MQTDASRNGHISVQRWATERPLFLLNILVAAGFWLTLVMSFSSASLTAALIMFFFLMHLSFIAHIRGSAVRLGQDQFPQLYADVEELAFRMGFKRMPEIYLMHGGGQLNAFATRFLRSHFVVLFTDLLEACGDNRAARDMIVGHELGHIHAGHLRWAFFRLPAGFIPFLGSAYSRACEFTCDRYGRAAAGDDEGALVGLTILAAGPKYGSAVNRTAFVNQQFNLRSGWMLLGEWLASHPPLSRRLTALAPSLMPSSGIPPRSGLAWVSTGFACSAVVAVGAAAMYMWSPRVRGNESDDNIRPSVEVSRRQVEQDFEELTAFIDAQARRGQAIPWDFSDLQRQWEPLYPQSDLEDPFSGYWYEYQQQGSFYRLISAGPDSEWRTLDDIIYDSRTSKK
jgi:Zn-dependent protease with chaperone function